MDKPILDKPQRAKDRTFIGGYVSKDLATQVRKVMQADDSTVSQVMRTALAQFLKQRKASAA